MANETEQTLRRMSEAIKALNQTTTALEQRVATLERRHQAAPTHPEKPDDRD